jgi:hypothetical protein
MMVFDVLITLCQTVAWRPPASAAWRPLLDPMPVDTYWMWLMVPLIVGIAVVYKALKVDDLAAVPSQALVLATQLVLLMAAAAAILWLVSDIS